MSSLIWCIASAIILILNLSITMLVAYSIEYNWEYQFYSGLVGLEDELGLSLSNTVMCTKHHRMCWIVAT